MNEVKLSKGQAEWIRERTDCMGFEDDPFYMPLFAELAKGNIISNPQALIALDHVAGMYYEMYESGYSSADDRRDYEFGKRILAKLS